MRKKITAVLLAMSMLTGFAGCGDHNKNEELEQTKVTDMTVPDDNSDYGLIYYAPPEEEHISQLSENDIMQYIDNEVLLVAEEGVSRDEIAELAEEYSAEIVGEIEVSGDYQLRLDEVYDIDGLNEIISELLDEDIVYDAYPDYVMPVGDASVGSQLKATATAKIELDGREVNEAWNSNTDDIAWGFNAINAPQAQAELAKMSGIKPVRVGLVDSYFDIEHEDLGFAEVFYNDPDSVPEESVEHGSHTSGTFAAVTGNGIGIDGVYPYGAGNLYGVGNKIYDYSENKTYKESVMGDKIAYSELIVRNVKVINESKGILSSLSAAEAHTDEFWGFIYASPGELKKWWDEPSNHYAHEYAAISLGDFFRRMLHAGYDFVIVNSSGNESDSSIGHLESKYASWNNLISKEYYPEVYDRIIVVGSIGTDLNMYETSNAGERLDISAPGVNIYSSLPNNEYGLMSGTSMAAPHVAGVAAMVWTANSSLTGAQVKEIVRSSISDNSGDYPMVDAYKAVVAASKTTGEGTDEENERGSVLGFVVNKDDESEAVYGANLTFTNADTEEYYWAWTDEEGHFEMALPEGDYYLDVTARDYQDYSWKDGEETIHVDAEGVLYLDWIKMTKGSGGSGKKKKLPDGVSWVTEPEIEVDDILVGDMYSEYSSSDTPRSAPYVYYIQDGKYGLIDYYGTVQVEPEYDGFDGKSYSYDRFIAVYNKKTGETVYSLRGNGKNGVWYTEITDEVYGSFFIGEVNLSGYYKDPDDGKLYNYNNYQDSASPVNNVGNKNLYIAQETVVDPKKLELSDYDCIADGKGFFVCDAEGNELTKHYKYFYANSLGTDSAILNEEQPFCALSDDGETWELFSYKGDFLPYSFEAFECNSFGSVWAPGYSDDTDEFDGPFPFCATDGYIAAKIDGECGYLDTDGNVVVEFGIFEDIRPVHNGMAWVKYDGKWGVISFD